MFQRKRAAGNGSGHLSCKMFTVPRALAMAAAFAAALVWAFASATAFAATGEAAAEPECPSPAAPRSAADVEDVGNYLCFTAEEANSTVALHWKADTDPAWGQAWKTSTDKTTWTDYSVGDTITLANIGDTVYWRAKDDGNKTLGQEKSKYYQFSMSGKIAASGSIMTLLDPEDGLRTLKGNGKYCFYNLFRDCTSLTSAPDLPATEVASSCYCHMFEGCTSLTSAPDLPAKALSPFCYMSMFSGCTSLTSMPFMGNGSAIAFDSDNCCNSMFEGCSKLVVYRSAGTECELKLDCSGVTKSSATSNMFAGCSNAGGYNSDSPAPATGAFACYGAKTSSEKGGVTVAGDDRYETSAAVAKKAYPYGAEGIVVVTGENFPDALAASGLAGLLDYPVVLVQKNAIPQKTADAISELGAKRAIIVGGEDAVSSTVQDALAALRGGTMAVERVQGANRYATAVAVYEYGRDKSGGAWGADAILATGTNYPDALSISGYAFARKAPVFLTDPASGMDEGTQDALAAGNFARAIIVGGTACVNDEDYDLAAMACGSTQRLWGANRYATSKVIADFCLLEGFHAEKACIATGAKYPDALCGSALAGTSESVVLLAGPDDMSAFSVLEANKGAIGTIYYLGGDAAVTPAMRTAALAAAGLDGDE